jgi:GNAT superfamily N-acetyltransferase
VEIRPLDLSDAAATRAWYTAMRAGASAGRTAPLVTAEAALLASLRSNADNPSLDRRAHGAWDGGRCLGALLLELPRRENTHLAQIEIDVPPAYRRRGVGAALFDAACALAAAAGRRLFSGELHAPAGTDLADTDGGRFALARGFADRHREQHLVLELPVPDDHLEALERRARLRADGYTLTGWQGPVPPEWLETMARLHSLMRRDAPAGEVDRSASTVDAALLRRSQERLAQQGYRTATAFASAPGGRPAGYSTLLRPPGDGVDLVQDDTFVLRAHRGHRLGYLLKAANLRLARPVWPGARRVHTWTAGVNDAMLAVNTAFGFRPAETLHEVEAPVPVQAAASSGCNAPTRFPSGSAR